MGVKLNLTNVCKYTVFFVCHPLYLYLLFVKKAIFILHWRIFFRRLYNTPVMKKESIIRLLA